jgi:hypothetical protein
MCRHRRGDEIGRQHALVAEDVARRIRRARAQVLVHRPFGDGVRDEADADEARLVLGDEDVVRDHVREEVRAVAERECALAVIARRGGNAPQHRPAVRALERRGADALPDHGKVWKAGTREHQAREARRGGAQLRIGEGQGEQRVVGEHEMRLQPPCVGVGREERQR